MKCLNKCSIYIKFLALSADAAIGRREVNQSEVANAEAARARISLPIGLAVVSALASRCRTRPICDSFRETIFDGHKEMLEETSEEDMRIRGLSDEEMRDEKR